jgi:transcriptional regulator with XRE-family HTH domain
MATRISPRTRRDLTAFGANLARWRKIQGLTAQLVADRAAVTRATLRSIEHGNGAARLENVFAVARVLGQTEAILAATAPFPDRAASLLPGLLAATRTGPSPAGDDELTNEDLLHQDPTVLLGAREIEARLRGSTSHGRTGAFATMSNRSRIVFVPVTLAVLIALSGCTGGGGTADGTASKASGSGGSSDATKSSSSAGTTTAVIAEQKFASTAGGSSNTPPGGTVTTTLRALEVSGKTMTLRWAFRWDNPDLANDATENMSHLGVENIPMLTDTAHLKQYRPLCTEGSWQATGIRSQVACRDSALVSPSGALVAFEFTNHSTVEAWAVFAAPQDGQASFDVLVVDGWPPFSAVTPTGAK